MVKVLNHALIKHKLSIMREEKTSNYIFKQNLDEIAMLMAYEVTKDYPLKEKEIETPICKTTGYYSCTYLTCWCGSCGWLQKNHANCESRSYWYV